MQRDGRRAGVWFRRRFSARLYLPAEIAIINVSIGLVAVDVAHADQSFNITNLTPAN
jgi:hypothetical protein